MTNFFIQPLIINPYINYVQTEIKLNIIPLNVAWTSSTSDERACKLLSQSLCWRTRCSRESKSLGIWLAILSCSCLSNTSSRSSRFEDCSVNIRAAFLESSARLREPYIVLRISMYVLLLMFYINVIFLDRVIFFQFTGRRVEA